MLIKDQSDLDEHLTIHTPFKTKQIFTFYLDSENKIYLRTARHAGLSQKIICCPYCMTPFSTKKPREELRKEIIEKITSYDLGVIDTSDVYYNKIQNCNTPDQLLNLAVKYYIAQDEDIRCLIR